LFSRIFALFKDSFNPFKREKTALFISSITIAICLVVLSVVSFFSFYAIKKITLINNQKIAVIFNRDVEKKCFDACNEELLFNNKVCPECSYFEPKYLEVYDNDLEFDKNGKLRCKQCCDQLGLTDGSRIISFKCDQACSPNENSNYPKYYGSKVDNSCKKCLDLICDELNNEIINISGIEERVKSIYKEEVLRIWEQDLMGQSYFNAPYRGPMVDLPMGGEFIVSDEINSIDKLDEMLEIIKSKSFVDYVDTDLDKFIYFRSLVPVIITVLFIVVLISFFIPFFIVSNTIRLVIHSKQKFISTLRILGEKDFYIKLPFIFQGVWQGVIGGILASIFLIILNLSGFNIGVFYFINLIIQSSVEIDLDFLYYPLLIVLLLGVLLGVSGALKAISKYLK
tara:strand:- start:845 stop:2035 length:1191 start_codon:yes stop_codon:yes gene_type:complete